MVIDKVINYLSRQDGVEVVNTNDSGSHYFRVGATKIRVSDHFATSLNSPQTLNVVCTKDIFVATYGNKLLPVGNYQSLCSLLRNFVMVCDILKPLTKIHEEVVEVEKIVEKVVEVPTPSQNSSDWIYVGDLPQHLRDGIKRNADNVRKMSAHKLK